VGKGGRGCEEGRGGGERTERREDGGRGGRGGGERKEGGGV